MEMLYRAMIEDVDGKPKVGRSARELGVRAGDKAPHNDVDAISPNDVVFPIKGLSVSPDDPMNLEKHRRPVSLGGIGKDPVWVIDEIDLGPDLIFVHDSLTHGYIAPRVPMTLAQYEKALELLRDRWRLFQK